MDKITYLVTIKGNDVFINDYEVTATSLAEMFNKITQLLENVQKLTIELIHVDSIIHL